MPAALAGGSILTLLKLECRLNRFGKLHGVLSVSGKAGQQFRQKFELLARQNTEERIVHRTLQASETDQSVETLIGEGELHPSSVAWMRGLLEQAVGNQLVDLVGDEGAAQVEPIASWLIPSAPPSWNS
ncbi:hypothetical protein ACE10Z_33690 [Bradyrhizobium sp. Pha-3]|uniref:hypothetical protein n=1 Tax=Bradyrhizobium sp. Pha-3 TaxID=208375 RepID=UPI0035D4DDC1